MKRVIIGLALAVAGLLVFAACAGEKEEATATPSGPAPTKTPKIVEIPTQPPITKELAGTRTAKAAAKATKAAAAKATEEAAKPKEEAKGDADKGKTVFGTNCNACHPNGGKGVGPSLVGTDDSDEEITKVVKEGRGGMPGFPKLSDADIADLIAYIRSLK